MRKSILTILSVLLICGAAWARMTTVVVGRGVSAPASCADTSCTGFVRCQNLEGTGYDNSETWTSLQGTNDANYTSTVLRGSQSLFMDADTGQDSNIIYTSFTTIDNFWMHFRWRFTNATPPNWQGIFLLRNSSYQALASVAVLTNLQLEEQTNYGRYSSVAANTTYHVWINYVAGTGANAQMYVYLGTTTTRPVSPIFSITNGTGVGGVAELRLRSGASNDFIFDQILVDDAEIGDVCE